MDHLDTCGLWKASYYWSFVYTPTLRGRNWIRAASFLWLGHSITETELFKYDYFTTMMHFSVFSCQSFSTNTDPNWPVTRDNIALSLPAIVAFSNCSSAMQTENVLCVFWTKFPFWNFFGVVRTENISCYFRMKSRFLNLLVWTEFRTRLSPYYTSNPVSISFLDKKEGFRRYPEFSLICHTIKGLFLFLYYYYYFKYAAWCALFFAHVSRVKLAARSRVVVVVILKKVIFYPSTFPCQFDKRSLKFERKCFQTKCSVYMLRFLERCFRKS